MKISPLCLVLALIYPVSGLRGTYDKNRRLQEGTTAPSSEEIVVEDGSGGSYALPGTAVAPDTVVTDETTDTITTDTTTTDTTTTDVATTDTETTGTGKDAGKATDGTESGTMEEDDEDESEEVAIEEIGTGGAASAGTIENDDAAKHKSKSSSSSASSDSACQAFCQLYLSTCENANAFVDPKYPRGAYARRRLIKGNEPKLNRLKGGVYSALSDCVKACSGYPRPVDPADYENAVFLGENSIGDTFWCRKKHLDLAAGIGSAVKPDPFAAQVHCPNAGPSGGGMCTNAQIMNYPGAPAFYGYPNATAWEYIRAGTDTGRHLGYCQMYYNDYVADCTNAGIDDRTLPLALALIPLDTGIIILNNNVGKRDNNGRLVGVGITTLPDGVFRNLLAPEFIVAMIIDDGNIQSVGSAAFSALAYTQVISLNMQMLTSLPQTLLSNNVNLREFSIYNTIDKGGMITSIPDDFFRRNPFLERIVISGHKGLTKLPTCMFCNVLPNDGSVLKTLIMSNNGLTNQGVQPGMFNNLGYLEIWDFSGNQFTQAPAGWFSPGWCFSLRVVDLHNNPITFMDKAIFAKIPLLEIALIHNTDLISVPLDVFAYNPKLISYTVSPKPST